MQITVTQIYIYNLSNAKHYTNISHYWLNISSLFTLFFFFRYLFLFSFCTIEGFARKNRAKLFWLLTFPLFPLLLLLLRRFVWFRCNANNWISCWRRNGNENYKIRNVFDFFSSVMLLLPFCFTVPCGLSLSRGWWQKPCNFMLCNLPYSYENWWNYFSFFLCCLFLITWNNTNPLFDCK